MADRVADEVCQYAQNVDWRPPAVAVCLAGSARTLTWPIVHRSIKTNLIEAFGGAWNSTVFAAVKLGDSIGTSDAVTSSRALVLQALRHIGGTGRHVVVANDTAALPGARDSHSCQRHRDSKRPLYRSLVAQLNHRHACHRLIVEEEARRRALFDLVIYTRPDLVWPVAVHPYCFWMRGKVHRKRDYAFVMTRPHATWLLEQVPTALFECHVQWHGELPESFMMPPGGDTREPAIPAQKLQTTFWYKSRRVQVLHTIERMPGDSSGYVGVTRIPPNFSTWSERHQWRFRAHVRGAGDAQVPVPGVFASSDEAAAERALFHAEHSHRPV